MCPHDSDDSLHTGGSFTNATVLVYTHTAGSCSKATEVRTLSWMDYKPIRRCSVHHSRSEMPMVMAMTITVDSLLPRPKLDCDGCYDVAVKGLNIVVFGTGSDELSIVMIYLSLLFSIVSIAVLVPKAANYYKLLICQRF